MLPTVVSIAFALILAGCSSLGGSSTVAPSVPAAASPDIHGAAGFKTIFAFNGPDGAAPIAAMIALNGVLYGTTSSGGEHDDGVVFSITPNGKESAIYNFKKDSANPAASLRAVNGVLYGTTSNGIFAVNTNGSELWNYTFKGRYNGRAPRGGLIALNGVLYGTTYVGGNPYHEDGAFYSVTQSGKETPLYAFEGSPDGANPSGDLVAVKNVLYGTTSSGGGSPSSLSGNNGTIFSVTKSGLEKVVHAFIYNDGATPTAGLAVLNGVLYGTTMGGGAYSAGTVFSVTTAGSERVIHSFGGTADGKSPEAPLVVLNGNLYGTTAYGGTKNQGTVFEITTSGKERVLHDFSGRSDGGDPIGGLVALNGVLYGTTSSGSSSHGTVFALVPKQ